MDSRGSSHLIMNHEMLSYQTDTDATLALQFIYQFFAEIECLGCLIITFLPPVLHMQSKDPHKSLRHNWGVCNFFLAVLEISTYYYYNSNWFLMVINLFDCYLTKNLQENLQTEKLLRKISGIKKLYGCNKQYNCTLLYM